MSKYTVDFIQLSLPTLFKDSGRNLLLSPQAALATSILLDLDPSCSTLDSPYWFIGDQYVELHSKDSLVFGDGDLLNITFADLQENYFEDILHPTQLELDFFKLQLGYDWPFTKEMKQDD